MINWKQTVFRILSFGVVLSMAVGYNYVIVARAGTFNYMGEYLGDGYTPGLMETLGGIQNFWRWFLPVAVRGVFVIGLMFLGLGLVAYAWIEADKYLGGLD